MRFGIKPTGTNQRRVIHPSDPGKLTGPINQTPGATPAGAVFFASPSPAKKAKVFNLNHDVILMALAERITVYHEMYEVVPGMNFTRCKVGSVIRDMEFFDFFAPFTGRYFTSSSFLKELEQELIDLDSLQNRLGGARFQQTTAGFHLDCIRQEIQGGIDMTKLYLAKGQSILIPYIEDEASSPEERQSFMDEYVDPSYFRGALSNHRRAWILDTHNKPTVLSQLQRLSNAGSITSEETRQFFGVEEKELAEMLKN